MYFFRHRAITRQCLGFAGLLLFLVVCSGILAMLGVASHESGASNVTGSPATVEELSERHFPYKQGSTRTIREFGNLGTMIFSRQHELRHDGNGTISQKNLTNTANGRPLPLMSDCSQTRRIHNGYVELRDNDFIGNENDGWIPIIKVGANVGESWPGSFTGHRFTFVGHETRQVNDDSFRCAVVEERIEGNSSIKTLSIYALDLGLVSQKVYQIENGEERFVRAVYLNGLRSESSGNTSASMPSAREGRNAEDVIVRPIDANRKAQDDSMSADPLGGGKLPTEGDSAKPGDMFVRLFDGNTFKGWRENDGWLIRNGAFVNVGNGSNLSTDTDFREFELKLEFQLPEGGNSGVLLPNGEEVQLVDDAFVAEISARLKRNGRAFQSNWKCGAIHNRIAPEGIAYFGPGKWNSLRILVVDGQVTVEMNNTILIDRASIVVKSGPIVLMADKKTDTRFREISLRPIAP